MMCIAQEKYKMQWKVKCGREKHKSIHAIREALAFDASLIRNWVS